MERLIEHLDHAFQPITNPYTGMVYGFELLLRGVEKQGFHSIDQFFDHAYENQTLYTIDLLLRKKAFQRFAKVMDHLKDQGCRFSESIKLFYNLDSRVLEMPEYRTGNTLQILRETQIDQNNICFEISEKHQIKSYSALRSTLLVYKQQGYCVALDDFGTGFSGFELMFYSEPHVIKIDKHYITGISKDPKRKLYASHIVKMAHIEGAIVIAEGIETLEDLQTAQLIGCDFVQGYFIAKPTTAIDKIAYKYDIPHMSPMYHEYSSNSDALLIKKHLEMRQPLGHKQPISDFIDRIKDESDITTIPVVDKHHRPLGVIQEKQLKKYLYSRYGKEIIQHHPVSRYVSMVPIINLHQHLDNIIHIFASYEHIDGVIIADEGIYRGYLSAKLLLEIINLKNLEQAREQNPLTRLPGNRAIEEMIEKALDKTSSYYLVSYWDLDNFKPFNDRFGFKVGDRAIMMLADYLKKLATEEKIFVGHIGGDDFCVIWECDDEEKIIFYEDAIQETIANYAYEVLAFYDDEERLSKSYVTLDRHGVSRTFDLLGVSCAAIKLTPHRKYDSEKLSTLLASLKKESKQSPQHYASAIF